MRMTYKSGKSGAVAFVAFIGIGLALFYGWLTGGAYTETWPRPFDSSEWKSADTWGYTRCGMVADLQFREGVVGKTSAELTHLLGEAQTSSYDDDASYWLLCPSFLDFWILEVRWQDGRVISAIVRDT